MKKVDLFKKLALELWENEAIDQANYNFIYADFEKDFLRLCENLFSGCVLLSGEVID